MDMMILNYKDTPESGVDIFSPSFKYQESNS